MSPYYDNTPVSSDSETRVIISTYWAANTSSPVLLWLGLIWLYYFMRDETRVGAPLRKSSFREAGNHEEFRSPLTASYREDTMACVRDFST